MDPGSMRETAMVAPNPAAAILALRAASDSLRSSRERISRNDFSGAFTDSRNAVRFASSALLLRDGLVSDSAEGAFHALSTRFPGRLPLEEWLDLERIPANDSPGLYNMLLSAMGRLKKAGEQEAIHAALVAEAFVNAARAEMGI